MIDKNLSNNQKWSVILIASFLAMTSFDIGRPPVDLHQYRQTQTLSTIYNYFLHGIDLLSPQLDTNGSHSVVILEFPIYQAITAYFMRIFGYHEVIARIINILAVILSGLVLARVSESYVKKGSYVLVLMIFLLNPASVFWSSTILIDPIAALFSILSIYFLSEWISKPRGIYFLGALCFGVLATVTKLTVAFIPLATFFTTILICQKRPMIGTRKLILITLLYLAIGVSFFIWNRYSRHMNELNPHMYTNSSVAWYLGTMEQRFSPDVWRSLSERLIFNNFFWAAIFGLTCVTAFCRFRIKERALLISTISVFFCAAYLFIFINLNFVHSYYQLPINLVVGLVGGVGFSYLLNKINSYKNVARHLFIGLLSACLVASSEKILENGWVDISTISSPYAKSTCEYEIGNQVRSYLENQNINTKLIGVVFERSDTCWNGPHALMYYLKRRGYLVRNMNDTKLEKEPLDLILAIYRDKNQPKKDGWTALVTRSLYRSVGDYEFTIFQKNPRAKAAVKQIKTTGLVEGLNNNHFNTMIRLYELEIPPYSRVKVQFTAKSVNRIAQNHGYFIMRTYSGGYKFDQARTLSFDEPDKLKVFEFILEADRFFDYVIEFGQIRNGSYEIVGPVNVEVESRLKPSEKVQPI